MQEGKLDPTFVITHRPPLEQAADAYRMFNDKTEGCIKAWAVDWGTGGGSCRPGRGRGRVGAALCSLAGLGWGAAEAAGAGWPPLPQALLALPLSQAGRHEARQGEDHRLHHGGGLLSRERIAAPAAGCYPQTQQTAVCRARLGCPVECLMGASG